MNFNFSQKPDYALNTSMIDEMIRLYGTLVKFVLMDKIQDFGPHENQKTENSIFNDFKTLKTSRGVNGASEYEIWVLPSEGEGFPNGLNFMFGQFGLVNEDTLQVFVSTKSLTFLGERGIIHPKNVISNVLIFPNGKIMEITDCQSHVPGVNNKFLYSDMPSCYQLSLKSHNFDRSAVSEAIYDQGTMRGVETSGIDRFFEKEAEMSASIKEEATKDTLAVKCLNDVIVKTTQIDDVFGSS